MKFSCDSCHAQYNVSDEKVGPAGVRVRCKKCGNVMYIKRVEVQDPPPEDATTIMTAEKVAALRAGLSQPGTDPQAAAPEIPSIDNPSPSTLDREIGSALDSMFAGGDLGTFQAPQQSAPSVVPVPIDATAGLGIPMPDQDDRAETMIFTSTDMEKIADAAAKAEQKVAATPQSIAPVAEWYIAIRDEQIGPLQVDDIKRRFEVGEVDGDTLVWSTGLIDWRPLSTVDVLALQILPKQDVVKAARRVPTPAPPVDEPRKDQVTFKPSAASALAALASMAKEEMAASAPQAAAPFKPIQQDPEPLHDTTALLANIAGLPSPSPDAPSGEIARSPAFQQTAAPRKSQTVPKLQDFRDSPLASTKPRGGSKRTMMAIAGITLAVVAGGALAWDLGIRRPSEEKAQKALSDQLEKQRQEAIAAAQAADKAKQQAADVAAAAAAAQKQANPSPAPSPTAAPAPSAPPPTDLAHKGDVHHGAEKAPDKGHKEPHASPASPSAPPPAVAEREKERPAAKGSSDDFLGGTEVDKEFARELDGKGGGSEAKAGRHGPYIPPPPGQANLPENLSQSDIVGVVSNHRAAFGKCVQEQKKRDPNASGTVVMRWKIKPDGRTTDIAPRGDEGDPQLAACFKGQIKSLQFGQYRGPQMAPIDFPFSY